jgi:hypothetical protein
MVLRGLTRSLLQDLQDLDDLFPGEADGAARADTGEAATSALVLDPPTGPAESCADFLGRVQHRQPGTGLGITGHGPYLPRCLAHNGGVHGFVPDAACSATSLLKSEGRRFAPAPGHETAGGADLTAKLARSTPTISHFWRNSLATHRKSVAGGIDKYRCHVRSADESSNPRGVLKEDSCARE